jgi:hypothetical protein
LVGNLVVIFGGTNPSSETIIGFDGDFLGDYASLLFR